MSGRSAKLFVVALFAIALILLVNVAWWVFYQRTEKLLDYQLSRRLAAVAKTTAAPLATELVEALATGDLEYYLTATDILQQAREADSLSEVFILNDNYVYLATTALEADSVYFLADLNASYIDSVFYGLSEQAMVTPSYRTGKVYLKSAFVPLRDDLGSIAAVLGVEANVDYFDALADLRRNLYYSGGMSLVGGLLFGVLFLLFQRYVNRTEQRLYMNETHAYLGRMVAVVAHEVKNPLMIIRASAERLARKNPAPESGFIVEEVDRLDQIVTGYLDFARGSKGSLLEKNRAEQISSREMILNVRRHLQDKYQGQAIDWLEPEPHAEISFRGYPNSLRQVLLNLLINGADACIAGGRPIRVGITVTDTSANVVIRVIDQGPGIRKKDLGRLFEPFHTTRQTGSGLGLYLSRRIVTEMGGEMILESKTHEGTEVVITLPIMTKR